MFKPCTHLVVVFTLLGLLSIPASGAKQAEWDWTGVPRIVAVGDVHGAYSSLVALLERTGLVDETLHWSAGKTHLVQLGDVVDRGADSRKCMDLLMALERQAARAGGRVHVLVGNHDAMNAMGMVRDVSLEEFASYQDKDSPKRWEREFQRHYAERRRRAAQDGRNPPPEAVAREAFESTYPPGYFEHRDAFGPKGRYGKWIRQRNAAVRINAIVFNHADIGEEAAGLGIEGINRTVREHLSGQNTGTRDYLTDPKGSLWYRGFASVPLSKQAQKADQGRIERVLALLEADRMVVGHTVTGGAIETRFAGRHISIDTGMLELYRGGQQTALEIEKGRFRAIHPHGAVDLPLQLDEETLAAYLGSVIEVDPDNVGAHFQLAEHYKGAGLVSKEQELLEKAYAIPKPATFTFRRRLGDLYSAQGMPEKARVQYTNYFEGLMTLIESSPSPQLKFHAASFAVEEGVGFERAEALIRSALVEDPSNAYYKLTLGKILVRTGRPADAAAVLEGIKQDSRTAYQASYVQGLAYLAMNDTGRARAAFEHALEANPEGLEASAALEALDR